MLNPGAFSLANSPTSLCSVGTSATNEIIGHSENQWSVSANVTQGDIIELNFIPGINWSHGIFDVNDKYPDFAVLYAAMNFTIQDGSDTLFTFTLGKTANPTSLILLEINVTADNGALDPSPFYNNNSSSYSQAGGIAQSSGNCTLTVIDVWPSRTDPPIQLVLMRVWLELVDLVQDRTIDIFDIVVAAITFNSSSGQPRWNPKADVNGDGVIDRFDLNIIAAHFGENYS